MIESTPSNAFSERIFLIFQCTQRPETPAISYQETEKTDAPNILFSELPKKCYDTEYKHDPKSCRHPEGSDDDSRNPRETPQDCQRGDMMKGGVQTHFLIKTFLPRIPQHNRQQRQRYLREALFEI